MNERIRELAEQAWQYAVNNSRDGDGTHGWLYRDKFAELIVKECVIMADEFELDVNQSGLVDRMKKHFGVES